MRGCLGRRSVQGCGPLFVCCVGQEKEEANKNKDENENENAGGQNEIIIYGKWSQEEIISF
jgi:hypothetical protein